MIAAVFAVLFGLSLLPGRKPLCLKFAERISDGILPDGAVRYCTRLTWVWLAVLSGITALNVLLAASGRSLIWSFVLSPLTVLATFAVERPIRNRRFRRVFHTSGSTGKSKTIVKTFETLAREVAMHRRFYRAQAAFSADRTVLLATIDPNHMYGQLWMRLFPVALGMRADGETILTPETLLAKMAAAEKVFLVTTPSFLDRFTAYANQYDVPQNCVEIITSGALLTKDVSDRTKRVFGVEPRQIFGSTETGGVAWRRGDGPWQVFDEVKVRDVGGRIGVRSPFSFRRDYVMGDGLELAADGRSFRLLGRRDRLVKINEERVNLAEMEDRIRAMGYRDCALVKLSGARGDCLGLVLACEETNALELRKRFLPVFPKGTVPKKYRCVAEIPKNTQGKVLKSEIEKMF